MVVCERDGEGADRGGGEAWREHVPGESDGRQAEMVDHDEVGGVALGNGDRGGVRDRDGAEQQWRERCADSGGEAR